MLNVAIHVLLIAAVICAPFYYHRCAKKIVQSMATDSHSRLNNLNVSICAFILGALFLESMVTIPADYQFISKTGFFIDLFSFVVLQTIHRQVQDRLDQTPTSTKDSMVRSWRGISLVSILFMTYFILVNVMIPVVGTLPAVLVTITLINYCIPLLVRTSLSALAMHQSPLKQSILEIFNRAKSPIHEIYLVDHQSIRGANAFVCGPKYGFGPFRRSVFVTKSLFETLEPDEILAVFCHEASHFKLNHLFKRAAQGIFSSIITMLLVAFPFVFILYLVKPHPIFLKMGVPSIIATAILLNYWFIFQLIRKQEYEADLTAMTLGASANSLISALEKITQKNGQSRTKAGFPHNAINFTTHPSLDERIEAIQNRAIPKHATLLPSWQVSLSYASFVILSASLALMYTQTSKKDLSAQRNIASVKEDGQKLPPPKIVVKPDTGGADE